MYSQWTGGFPSSYLKDKAVQEVERQFMNFRNKPPNARTVAAVAWVKSSSKSK